MSNEFIKTKCPCCGSSEIIDEFPADNFRSEINVPASYTRCASCGSLYMNPQMVLDERNSDYDERYRQTYEKLTKKIRRKSYRIFSCWMYGLLSGFSHVKLPRGDVAGSSLLDIGCGIGLQTKLLNKRGVKITGIDSSEQAIKLALEVNDGENFICTNFSDFNNKEKFDFIRLDNVIEHIGNPNQLLCDTAEMLKHHGKLIIFTPNADSASLKILRGKSVSAWPSEHIVLFSKKVLTDLLEKSGFEINRIRGNTPAWWLAYNFLMIIGVGKKVTADSVLLRLFSLFFLPVTYILNFLNLEEEIIIVARKRLHV